MHGDQQLVRCCFLIFTQNNQLENSLSIDKLDQRENKEKGEPAEQLVFIPLKEEDPKKMVQIESQLPDPKRQQLINLLRANADIFAWSTSDRLGIPPEVITHRLNIDPKIKPFTPERQKIIDEEVNKLLAADFIRNATYPDWLANIEMMRKANKK